jgi:hypothetical protein
VEDDRLTAAVQTSHSHIHTQETSNEPQNNTKTNKKSGKQKMNLKKKTNMGSTT